MHFPLLRILRLFRSICCLPYFLFSPSNMQTSSVELAPPPTSEPAEKSLNRRSILFEVFIGSKLADEHLNSDDPGSRRTFAHV